ncbi:MAG: hypothetical protein CME61_07535 [Halobacteriovoraceae bacterium]|nr:hypothetical protein [Halobacteriovoraceae bacterium]|tara:strand:- start:253 stop:687 length:435 start_codon:yes stop_codon:yes gene_type:complete
MDLHGRSPIHFLKMILLYTLFSVIPFVVHSVEIKQMVKCRDGFRLVVDAGKKSEFKQVDYCERSQDIFDRKIISEAFCPRVTRELLSKKIKMNKKNFFRGRGIASVFDNLVNRRVKFMKISHEGRDTCLLNISESEVKELTFIP